MARCAAFREPATSYAKSYGGLESGGLFHTLPDCTVKTAWVTLGAHRDPERRVDLQIAVARLGLDILFSPEETLKGLPHWTTTQEVEEIRRVVDANRAACPAPPLQPSPALATVVSNNAEDSE